MQTALEQEHYAPKEIEVLAGDCAISTPATHRLITRDLLSCVAVAVHAPTLSIGALLRFSFPGQPGAEESNEWLSANTAIPALFEKFRDLGVSKSDLSVYAVGGANVATADEAAVTGKRNVLALRKALWREGILLRGDDTGGTSSRSVSFDGNSGRIIVRARSLNRLNPADIQGAKPCHFAC